MTVERQEPVVDAKDQLPKVVPYVARQISDFSTEDMRTDVEDELRSIAKAIESLSDAVKGLNDRITALEPKP